MTKNYVRTAGAAALLLACALAQAAIRLDAPIPVGPQVKVGKLANGLTYYIQKNARPAKKLELRLVVKAGSILEDDDQQGLAHFTEHMAFNGTRHFKKHELVSYLQSIGVKFGADLNAYTSFDETVYVLPIPTDRRSNVDKGFLVLEDWAHGLTLDSGDIEQERGIVLEELRLGKGAGDRMNKVLMPKLFNGSRYAQRLPIGLEATIRSFKPDALRRFYRDWYRPDLMAVVVVGDIDPADAERRVKAHFGKLANPRVPRQRSYADIPTRAATEALVITDREAGANTLLIRYPVAPATDDDTFGDYRGKLVETLFASMLNQRLQELTQQGEPPFINASSEMARLTPRYKSYAASATLGKGGARPAIDALVQENARARQFGFSAGELERAKKNLMRTYELAYNERDKTDSASYVAEYIRNFLEQESIPGIANEYDYVREMIPGITLDEMNRHARNTIPADASKLVVYMGGEKSGDKGETATPTSAELLAAIASAETTPVLAQDQKSVGARLMEQPPAPGRIVAERQDKALGLTYLTLSNGVKVILKPTDFRNDQVRLSASRFGGQSLYGDADALHTRYGNAVVAAMGIKDYSPLDLQKVLAGKTATVAAGLGNFSDVVGGSASVNDVETMLQLVHLKFAAVRRDEELFKSFVGKQEEGARTALSSPEALFRDTVIGTMYGGHPRVPRAPRPGDFAGLDLDRIVDIYQQRFASAKGLTFVIVGSFDPAVVKPLIATYLASLPTADLPIAYKDTGVRPVRGVVRKEVRSGTEAKSSVSINFSGPAAWSEQEQLRFQAMVEVLNLRITAILREKLALIYGGGINGSLARHPWQHYVLGISLPTGPDKVDQVIAATFAEIARMKQQGPDLADLNKVKENWRQSHQKSLREDAYWLNRLQTAALEGSDPGDILRYDKQVAAISAADLQRAAVRYFDMKNYVQVVLYPEK